MIEEGWVVRFDGPHRFLSNFYPIRMRWRGGWVRSVENAYQAAKTEDRFDAQEIALAPSPGLAKRLGSRVWLRPEWDRIKDSVMQKLVARKFRDPVLRAQLLATRPLSLQEGNNWGDTYWGAVKQGGVWVGENRLGKILMGVRDGAGIIPVV